MPEIHENKLLPKLLQVTSGLNDSLLFIICNNFIMCWYVFPQLILTLHVRCMFHVGNIVIFVVNVVEQRRIQGYENHSLEKYNTNKWKAKIFVSSLLLQYLLYDNFVCFLPKLQVLCELNSFYCVVYFVYRPVSQLLFFPVRNKSFSLCHTWWKF